MEEGWGRDKEWFTGWCEKVGTDIEPHDLYKVYLIQEKVLRVLGTANEEAAGHMGQRKLGDNFRLSEAKSQALCSEQALLAAYLAEKVGEPYKLIVGTTTVDEGNSTPWRESHMFVWFDSLNAVLDITVARDPKEFPALMVPVEPGVTFDTMAAGFDIECQRVGTDSRHIYGLEAGGFGTRLFHKDKSTIEQLSDQNFRLRVPRDGFDLKIIPLQEEDRLIPLTKVSDALKAFLASHGQENVRKEGITYVPLQADDYGLASDLTAFANESRLNFGIAVVGGDKYAHDIFTYAEKDGAHYRVLKIPETFDLAVSEFVSEANKIFVPSEGIDTSTGQFMLMPILDEFEHPDDVTQAEIDDFTQRLRSSRIAPSPDLGMSIDESTGKQFPETNLVRHNGRLYICDAGDLLLGKLDVDRERVVQAAQVALKERLPK